MAIGLRLKEPGLLWLLLSVVLAAGSVLAWWQPAAWLDWQPREAADQPWRWWTAAFVHWSEGHLASNVVGLAVVASLGVVGRLPARAALAWCAAWPFTHLALLLQPELAHFGGLSGLLHAGVAVAATWLARDGDVAQRRVALAIGAGLVLKILLEAPWGPALRHPQGWDIAVAPLAHASGALAGFICAWAGLGQRKRWAR